MLIRFAAGLVEILALPRKLLLHQQESVVSVVQHRLVAPAPQQIRITPADHIEAVHALSIPRSADDVMIALLEGAAVRVTPIDIVDVILAAIDGTLDLRCPPLEVLVVVDVDGEEVSPPYRATVVAGLGAPRKARRSAPRRSTGCHRLQQ